MVEQIARQRWWADAEHDPIHEAAADWVLRLQDPDLKLEDTASWQDWMAADPRHAEAFRRIEEVWRDAAAIEDRGSRDAPQYDPRVSVTQWQSRRASHRRMLGRLAWAAVVACALVGASWFLATQEGQRIETTVGQNRSVTLPDGSQVVLGGATVIRASIGTDSRRIALVRGEAFFSVAKDPTRPFRVTAGDTTVTAVGTAFDVRRNAGRVVVAVVEGHVTVDGGDVHTRVPVAAGERTVVVKSSATKAVLMPRPAEATAWRSGRLSFDHEPLRYVLEDVNRYSTKPIVVAEEETGNLRITGTVLSDNVSGWIASVERAFGLEAVEDKEEIVLKRASAQD